MDLIKCDICGDVLPGGVWTLKMGLDPEHRDTLDVCRHCAIAARLCDPDDKEGSTWSQLELRDALAEGLRARVEGGRK